MTINNWFYRLVRSRTNPINEDTAFKWKRRLSIAYGLVAWNAFGYVLFMIYNGKADWAHYYGLKTDEEKNIPPAKAWAKTLGIDNAKVYRISGLQKVDEYDIVNGEEVRQTTQNASNQDSEHMPQ